MDTTDIQLEESLTIERNDEMESSGRNSIYPELRLLLDDKKRRVLDLVNHGMAMVDDVIDSIEDPLVHLGHIQSLFMQSYSGETIEATTPDEKAVVELGNILKGLSSSGIWNLSDRALGKHTYDEVLKYWETEVENLQRKGRILNRKNLNRLNIDIGGLVASQILFIIQPPLGRFEFIQLAKAYGFAVKLADNLCDWRQDLQEGIINIPKEDIHHVRGVEIEGDQVKRMDVNEISLSMDYKSKEFKLVKRMFESADNLLLRARLRVPIWDKNLDKKLCLFGKFCRTWLKSAGVFMAIEILRSYDISNNSGMPVLTVGELRKIEQEYDVIIRDIIAASYKQESKNTQLVTEKHPNYNPYFHEKTPEANQKIRALLDNHPELQNVLDLGCNDGERTVDLYGGTKLYGMETVKTAAEKAQRKGINICQESMIDSIYRDSTNPDGRKFDLVSLTGEMVNFVGLDTDPLLEKSLKQVKDGGYFLVTCIHPKFDKNRDGKYCVWTHTKSTYGKWLLNEEKIPRVFLFLSKEGLRKRLDKILQSLECKISFQDSRVVNDYYEDAELAIHLFRIERQKNGQ